ncbi:hypothetical protein Tco_0996973, partial [Tanacetum coccineum]
VAKLGMAEIGNMGKSNKTNGGGGGSVSSGCERLEISSRDEDFSSDELLKVIVISCSDEYFFSHEEIRLMGDISFLDIDEDQTQVASTSRLYKKISMTECVIFLKVHDAPTVVDQYVTKPIKSQVKLTNCVLALRAINVDLDVGSSRT